MELRGGGWQLSPSCFVIMEVLKLSMQKWIYKVKPPCPKCPYKLGIIKTPVNPCPQCKLNGYQAFEQFRRQAEGRCADVQRP